jgi:hypothetical protein
LSWRGTVSRGTGSASSGLSGQDQPRGEPGALADHRRGVVPVGVAHPDGLPKGCYLELVGREVEWWIRNRPSDRILIAWAGSEIAWGGEDFDWSLTDALPEQLARVFRSEPHWIDLRSLASIGTPSSDGGPTDGLSLGDVVADFAAPIRGVPKDTLIGAHVRERRRTRRTVRGVIALLSVLLVAVSAAGIYARTQRNEAVQQRDVARQQLRTASSRQLIAQAQIALPEIRAMR